MPDYIKISELPTASSVAGTDQIELNQSGTSRSATLALVQAVVQTVAYQTGAMATTSTAIPFDDTIPQITEGTEFMTLAITPKSATNRLIIDVIWCGASASAGSGITVALFQDSTANALAAVPNTTGNAANSILTSPLRHTMISGTTSATTFRVRAGAHGAIAVTFNGASSARMYGGVMASSIVIQEVAP